MAHFYYPTLYSAHLLGRLWAWLVETNETAVFGCYVPLESNLMFYMYSLNLLQAARHHYELAVTHSRPKSAHP